MIENVSGSERSCPFPLLLLQNFFILLTFLVPFSWNYSYMTQETCLQPKLTEPCESSNNNFSSNFLTTFNQSHGTIKKILNTHWPLLLNDPHLKKCLPAKPRLTNRRARTLKNISAPGKFRSLNSASTLSSNNHPPGCYRCNSVRCKNCVFLDSFVNSFSSTVTGRQYNIFWLHLPCFNDHFIFCNKRVLCPFYSFLYSSITLFWFISGFGGFYSSVYLPMKLSFGVLRSSSLDAGAVSYWNGCYSLSLYTGAVESDRRAPSHACTLMIMVNGGHFY